ncbi:hypothetical protein ACFE04_002722 [Oxalis oulophora]
MSLSSIGSTIYQTIRPAPANTISSDEVAVTARAILEEAFATTGNKALAEDDEIENLQVYSKDISRRILDSMYARANAREGVTQLILHDDPVISFSLKRGAT